MMKKIIIITSTMCMVLAAGLFLGQNNNEVVLTDLLTDNVEALGDGYCPNGCVENGPGCDCNGWNPCYMEFNWEVDE
jgi:hypothetical protein